MKATVFLSSLALFAAGRSLAATSFFISNVGQLSSGPGNLADTNYRYATDFRTNNATSNVTGVVLKLNNLDTIVHTFTASIYTDISQSPGTLVGSFDAFSVNPNGTYADYSAGSTGIVVGANTTYWIVVQMNENIGAGSTPQLSYNDTQNTDSGSVFTTVPSTALKTSTNGGASYTDVTFFGSPVNGNYQFALVPEPSAATLAALSLMAFRRKRVRQAAC